MTDETLPCAKCGGLAACWCPIPVSDPQGLDPAAIAAFAARLDAVIGVSEAPYMDLSLTRAEARHIARALRDSRDAERMFRLLAGAWLYGGWKAETFTEREMEALMRERGWWPITEDELISRDAASRPTAGGTNNG